jgi:rod shape-determining protein MreC
VARRRSVLRRAGGGRKIAPGVLLAIALVIGGMVLVSVQAGRNGGAGQATQQTGDGVAAQAGQVATGPARAGEDFFSRLFGGWNAASRIEQLESENRELLAWRELAERLAERNARYEELLRMPADSFGEGADIESSIAAQLVLDSGGPFTRTLVANAGADHGVRVGYIAVNENGLIGRVVSVGRRSARILMLDDYNSRIPVMGEASRVRAVLAGQATRPPDLYTHPFQMQSPRLDFIVGAQSLREGERVVTSGDGGLYPRGIPVGVARSSGDGQWRVALAASQRPIDFVRILPFVGVERPEDAPVSDEGPPLAANSSFSSIGRETLQPAPTTPTPVQPPRPRRTEATNAAAPPAPVAAGGAPAEQPQEAPTAPPPAPAPEAEAPE